MSRNAIHETSRQQLRARLSKLHPESPALWGRMNVPEMLHHLNDQMDLIHGDLQVEPVSMPLLRTRLGRFLSLSRIPWPRGRIRSPGKMVRREVKGEAEINAIRQRLFDSLERFAALPASHAVDHPFIGSMNKREWGRLTWKHFDHHLRQFGV